jgi:hypothetical protein
MLKVIHKQRPCVESRRTAVYTKLLYVAFCNPSRYMQKENL